MKRFSPLLYMLVLAACSLGQPGGGGPQAQIDAPTNGAVLPLAPYVLVAHATAPTGITQVEFSVDGAVIGSVAGSGSVVVAQQTWTPAASGGHTIQVRAQNTAGIWSAYAEARITVQGQAQAGPQAQAETPTTEMTETPTLTPAPTATETTSVPTLVLIQNANCRRGPSQVYDVLTSLLKGQSVPIIAKSEEGTWLLVHIPTGETCWISGVTGTTAGKQDALPFATGMPGCYVLDASSEEVCTIPCPKKNPKPADQCTP
jgi:hypothetical protein